MVFLSLAFTDQGQAVRNTGLVIMIILFIRSYSIHHCRIIIFICTNVQYRLNIIMVITIIIMFSTTSQQACVVQTTERVFWVHQLTAAYSLL